MKLKLSSNKKTVRKTFGNLTKYHSSAHLDLMDNIQVELEPEDEVATPLMPKRGRGALTNPAGRFERIDADYEPDEDVPDQIKTEFYADRTKNIIAYNDSPDIGFNASLNPYRGCEHGCIYCFARPSHEYLGLSSGLDFETKIFVKQEAPALLRRELALKSWQPQVVVMSGVTDCYQPFEKHFRITRQCLEIFHEFRNPIAIITKNHLVTRDIDILSNMAKWHGAQVNISITTLDRDLARAMEPRASTPARRIEAVKLLAEAGIPVNVMVAPIIPGLTDEEMPAILKAVAEAGATSAAYTMLRLPYNLKEHFEQWLEQHAPLRKQKVLNRIRDMRGGKLYDARWGKRMRGEGEYYDSVIQLFSVYRKKYGLDQGREPLSIAQFKAPTAQLDLW
jgi:DNA repair photolyase